MSDKAISIGDLARASGVSTRTLRHYDAIGLLTPSATTASGERLYDTVGQLRLQRILVLRELKFPLDEIARVLAAEVDELSALRDQRARVQQAHASMQNLLITLDKTITALERGEELMPKDLYAGLDPAKQAAYEADLVERFGPDVQPTIDDSKRRMSTWTASEKAAIPATFAGFEARLAELLVAGADPSAPDVQAVVAEHYHYICRFWTPDANAYAALGDLYVEHPDFKARKDAVHPGLAEFERDAMAVYAIAKLS